MKRILTSLIIIFVTFVVVSTGNAAGDFSGTWSGTWNQYPIWGSGSGAWSMNVNQAGTSLSGTVSVFSTGCGDFNNVPFTGSVNGNNATINTLDNAIYCNPTGYYYKMELDLALTGANLDHVQGMYTETKQVTGGATDQGTFTGTRTSAAPSCTYTLSPTNYGFSPSSGTGSITVTPSEGGCSWTATSSAPWITIASGSTGQGNGTVSYRVAANTSGSARKGTMTVAVSTITIRQAGSTFTDVSATVYTPYIYSIYTEGITTGCGSGMYCPSSNVTRGQMAAFIIRAMFGESFSYTTTPYYSDVPSTNTYFKYVQKLKDLGLTTTTGTYMVDDNVTREQMAAFIIRGKYGETFSYTTTPYFSDVASTSIYYKYVQKMKDDAITTTTGIYMASQYVTREQMAAFLGRAFLGMQ